MCQTQHHFQIVVLLETVLFLSNVGNAGNASHFGQLQVSSVFICWVLIDIENRGEVVTGAESAVVKRGDVREVFQQCTKYVDAH